MCWISIIRGLIESLIWFRATFGFILHFVLESNIVLFTPLHLFDNISSIWSTKTFCARFNFHRFFLLRKAKWLCARGPPASAFKCGLRWAVPADLSSLPVNLQSQLDKAYQEKKNFRSSPRDLPKKTLICPRAVPWCTTVDDALSTLSEVWPTWPRDPVQLLLPRVLMKMLAQAPSQVASPREPAGLWQSDHRRGDWLLTAPPTWEGPPPALNDRDTGGPWVACDLNDMVGGGRTIGNQYQITHQYLQYIIESYVINVFSHPMWKFFQVKIELYQ